MDATLLEHLRYESSGAHAQHMAEIKASRGVTNHIVRASAAKYFDEPTPAAARAIDKVLRLPTRGPVVMPDAKPAPVTSDGK